MSVLRVHRDPSRLTFLVAGRATMEHSMPLRRLAEQALADGCQELRVDLRNCLYMDSTFIGTLVLLRKSVGAEGRFTLVCPSTACEKVLEAMTLDRLFVIDGADVSSSASWDEATPCPDDLSKLKYNVVQSHQELAALNGPAAGRCRAVAEMMQKELEQEHAHSR